LRGLLISFGSAGYVALFEIEDAQTVTILAVRHQREEDYLQPRNNSNLTPYIASLIFDHR
jgi:hypothetical protein